MLVIAELARAAEVDVPLVLVAIDHERVHTRAAELGLGAGQIKDRRARRVIGRVERRQHVRVIGANVGRQRAGHDAACVVGRPSVLVGFRSGRNRHAVDRDDRAGRIGRRDLRAGRRFRHLAIVEVIAGAGGANREELVNDARTHLVLAPVLHQLLRRRIDVEIDETLRALGELRGVTEEVNGDLLVLGFRAFFVAFQHRVACNAVAGQVREERNVDGLTAVHKLALGDDDVVRTFAQILGEARFTLKFVENLGAPLLNIVGAGECCLSHMALSQPRFFVSMS